MKKVLLVIFTLIIFTGCTKNEFNMDEVEFVSHKETLKVGEEVKFYLTNIQQHKSNYLYYWEVDSGEFMKQSLTVGRKVLDDSTSMLWTANETTKTNTHIHLQILDINTKKVLKNYTLFIMKDENDNIKISERNL